MESGDAQITGGAVMTTTGWIFMVCSVGFVVGLTFFFFFKVLTKPASADHMHAALGIDTKDSNT